MQKLRCVMTHSKQQGWDWSAAPDMNHGQQAW